MKNTKQVEAPKQVTEAEMRATYVKAFGKEFDAPERKQFPLPIHIAYEVAKHQLNAAKGGAEK
jgi:hypothetical protein